LQASRGFLERSGQPIEVRRVVRKQLVGGICGRSRRGELSPGRRHQQKALALFPSTEAGKPGTNAQQTVKHFLEEYRQELKERGG
jgi:hypothetical protein